MQQTDEAIILVGGRGTRLQSVISDVPKPLAPVAGRPFIARVLDRLEYVGMRRVVLATGYMADVIQQTIGTCWNSMEISYSVEDAPLGTGGAIRHAAAMIHGRHAHVLNGDTYLEYSPADLEAVVNRAEAKIGVALAHVDDVARYGAVELESDHVSAFSEKGRDGAGLINAGCYFVDLDYLPSTPSFSFESEVLLPAALTREVVATIDTRGFIDIGVPEDFRRAQLLFGSDEGVHF